ncbi:MAG: hypothetical protein AB7V48_12380 [Sedimentibacter sp.]
MKRQIRVQMLKRFFCLTIAIICLASNVTLAYAALVYDSTKHTREEMFEMDDKGPLIKARISGDGYEITGNAVDADGTIVLDNSNKASFNVINYDNGRYRMFHEVTVYKWDNGNSYGLGQEVTLNDGKVYYSEVIKEEMNVENLLFEDDYGTTGRFNFKGEYTLRPVDGSGATNNKLTVSVQGKLVDYTYMYSRGNGDNGVYLLIECVADNNQAIYEINGEKQIKKFEPADHDLNNEDIGIATIEYGMQILNAEFDAQGGAVTPVKVTAAAAASVALATTGSVALSSVSGTSGDILDLGEAENEGASENDNAEEENEEESEEESEESEESGKQNDDTYSFIVNNGDSLPPLCNTKGATVTIPLSIEDGEVFNWNYNVIPFPVRPDIFVPGILSTGDNSAELSVLITGKKLEENSTSIYCYVSATAVTDEGENKAQETIEFTLYNTGLYAKVKDNSKSLTKDNLTMTYVRDSKIKGMAEIITLKDNEYDIEAIEETDSVLKVMITAVNKEFGRCALDSMKGK